MNGYNSAQSLKTANRVSLFSILGNIVLTAFKLAAGIVGHSAAMISDAVHSASDVASTVVVMIGMKLSTKDADDDHEYGHERLECIAALLLAMLLALTGLGIGSNAVTSIIQSSYRQIQMPGMITLIAAIVSILVKELMYQITKVAANKINSAALMADAWHHRSDALSSVGSLIGIAAARLGFPICDPIASVIICLFILHAAYKIFMDAVSKLTDKACSSDVQDRMRETALTVDGVLGVDLLNTRQFGNRIYVDIEISAVGDMTLTDSHQIAVRVHDLLEQTYPEIKHCMVHMNPAAESNENKAD